MLVKKYNHITDNELLELFNKSNNNEWLGILLQRYTLLLIGVSMKYLKNETLANDAVQQVFLKCIIEIPKTKITFFKSWIYMVTRNHCLMQLRYKHEVQEFTDNIDFIDEETPYLNKENNLQFLEESLPLLNEDQRNCIHLFYLNKKTYLEIVDVTSYSLMQVKSHIQNGKRNLKILIEKKLNQHNG